MNSRGNSGQYGATEYTTPQHEFEYFDKLPLQIRQFLKYSECNFSCVNIYDVWSQYGTETALRSMRVYNRDVRKEAYGVDRI